jgi:hypothetical protein
MKPTIIIVIIIMILAGTVLVAIFAAVEGNPYRHV